MTPAELRRLSEWCIESQTLQYALRQAADTIETLTRERDDARENGGTGWSETLKQLREARAQVEQLERERDALIVSRKQPEEKRDRQGFPLKPNTGKPYDPIDDKRLAYLDDWYQKCPSNSLMFCDADYLELRTRLRVSEAERDAARAQVDLLATALRRIAGLTPDFYANLKLNSCIDVAREALKAAGLEGEK